MNSNPQDAIVVLMTAPSKDEADRIAEMLVSQGLAACVQMLTGMESVYRWKGKVQRDREVLMLAKTIRARFDDLESKVSAMHSYETPEIIALPITAGSEAYLRWVADSLPAGS